MEKIVLILILTLFIISCENIAGKMSTVPPSNLHLETINQNNEILVNFNIFLSGRDTIAASGTSFVKIINNGGKVVYDKAITVSVEDFQEQNTIEGTVLAYEFEISKDDIIFANYVTGKLELSLSTDFWTISDDTIVFGLPTNYDDGPTQSNYVNLPICED